MDAFGLNVGLQREIEGIQERKRELEGRSSEKVTPDSKRSLSPRAFNGDNVLEELRKANALGQNVLNKNAVASVIAAESNRQNPALNAQKVC